MLFYVILLFIFFWLPVLLIFVYEKPPWGVDNKICIVWYCIFYAQRPHGAAKWEWNKFISLNSIVKNSVRILLINLDLV